MSIKSALAVAVIVAASAAALLPLGSAPAAKSRSFTLRSYLDQSTLHRGGDAAGDVTVLATRLTRHGKAAGRGLYVHTSVDDRYRGVSMIGHLMLRKGTLELQGEALELKAPGLRKPPAEFDLAIVGGTGAYAGATGTVHPVDVRSRQDLHIRLR